MKTYLIDYTKEFLAKSKPGIGSITLEEGLDINTHQNEIETAHWLLNTFGGNITVLKEKNMYKIKTPDYEWDGKYWELKTAKSSRSLQKLFRKGIRQIVENQGGVIIDITNLNIIPNKLCGLINHLLYSYKLTGYVIVKRKLSLISVLKRNKKRN